MPQMSPMNWLLLSVAFFMLMNTININLPSTSKTMKYTKPTIKTLKWKW